MTKELLYEVFGMYNMPTSVKQKEQMIIYKWENSSGIAEDEINIFELSHLCKEWAIGEQYAIFIELHYMNSVIVKVLKMYTDRELKQPLKRVFDSEEDAIFAICEWILKQKER